MQFGYIAPTAALQPLNILDENKFHLVLAHLVESDKVYAELYRRAAAVDGATIILDNSGFELYKQGKPMFDPEKLIDLGKKVNAQYIVLPDYPGEDGEKSRAAAEVYAPKFHAAGFKTFYVPQSKIGDLPGLVDECNWAFSSPLIDYIGISILAVPNAYGVEQGNNLQRYLSRYSFMQILNHQMIVFSGYNIHEASKKFNTKVHFLGMVDGPNEIELMMTLIEQGIVIDTWDSSSPVWAGINNVRYDNSPTGLINGKIESHVDFGSTVISHKEINGERRSARANIDRIRYKVNAYTRLVGEYEAKLSTQATPAAEVKATEPVATNVVTEKTQLPFRFFEDEAIEEITKYVASTYSQHYVADEDELNIQAVDIWKALGSLTTTSRDTALKYLMRYGKKEGYNRKDLLKAIHYIILMMSTNRGTK
ncbi:DUF3310 domain-containing protein [Rhizobium phage RHph_I1_18]|nr:DUF3310 domain-containing protein [Rhizobium phage RHph_I1_18]